MTTPRSLRRASKRRCTRARGVSVRGAADKAEVRLYLNGAVEPAAVDIADPADGVARFLDDDLQEGDVLEATQVVAGLESERSRAEMVVEYPGTTLPAPVIDPATRVRLRREHRGSDGPRRQARGMAERRLPADLTRAGREAGHVSRAETLPRR